jgi:hypothetical protein
MKSSTISRVIVLEMPAQYGNDGGVVRMYDITTDKLTDRPLVNNQPYYFAVTAYAYSDNPDASPRQLESTPVIIEVRAADHRSGVRFGEQIDTRFRSIIPLAHPPALWKWSWWIRSN